MAEFDRNAPIWHVHFDSPKPMGPDPENPSRMRMASVTPAIDTTRESGVSFDVASQHAVMTGGRVEPHLPVREQ